ncbi:hypothetical protein L484_019331 [Morus notabilis]|uniref:Putative plant transposon protein domain-containing protein n=1 Tax=Morus notabilis TaxID=981085 RepID=W9QZA7_9ROSA|nr:hypothetical protein L484_019331 [Morus notabilis]
MRMSEVLRAICYIVRRWTLANGVLSFFDSRYLEKNMKVWHHFFRTRLHSRSHTLEVSRERALALYAIKKGLTMNISGIINTVISYAIRNKHVGLAFPSLITKLIEMAGVEFKDNNNCKPVCLLDFNSINQIWSNQAEEGGVKEVGRSRQAPKRKSKAKVTTSDWYDAFE